MKKFFKEENSTIKVGLTDKFQTFVKANMRSSDLYDDRSVMSKVLSLPNVGYASTPNNSTQNTTPLTQQNKLLRNGSYGLYEFQKRRYIRELKTWDETIGWEAIDEDKNTAKFFSTGMMLQYESEGKIYELFGANLQANGTTQSTDEKVYFISIQV